MHSSTASIRQQITPTKPRGELRSMEKLTVSFYSFFDLEDPRAFQSLLYQKNKEWQLHGTVILASEGINGGLCGPGQKVVEAIEWIENNSDAFFENLKGQAFGPRLPFDRFRVKLRREIVTFGVDGAHPRNQVGTYVEPAQWNQLISRPEVTLLEGRNSYEYRVGHFKGTIDPQTRSFRQFPELAQPYLPEDKEAPIAMFCTGGIRCEKATSYLIQKGYKNVYHLKGGILRYLEEIPPEESLWEGDCFVFDQRVAVGNGLAEGEHWMCWACGMPNHNNDPSCYNCHKEKG